MLFLFFSWGLTLFSPKTSFAYQHLARFYWTYNKLSTDFQNGNSNSVFKHYYLISQTLKFYQSIQGSDYNLLQNKAIDIYGLTQRCLGKQIWKGTPTLVRLNNYMLTFIYDSQNQDDIDKYADSMSQFNDYLKERNIPLLFTLFPFKVHIDDSQLPLTVRDYTNDNATRFLSALNKREIQFVDTRLLYKHNSSEHYRQFYIGDHHWKPEYAYHAYLYISKQLKDRNSNLATYFSDTDMAVKNYSVIRKYPPFYKVMGSQERRLGYRYMSDVDWTDYLIPRAKTNYSFIVPIPNGNTMTTEASGSLEDTFLYYWHDMPLEIVINNNTASTNKILVIHDSFMHVFLPFLATNNKEVHLIDVRHYQGKVVDYVEKIKPDVVIVAYNVDNIQEMMFRFFEEKEE